MPNEKTLTIEEWRERDALASSLEAERAARAREARQAHERFSLTFQGARPVPSGLYSAHLDLHRWEEALSLREEADRPVDTGRPNRTLPGSRDERTCATCGTLLPRQKGSGQPRKTCSEGCRKARTAKGARQARAGVERFSDERDESGSWGKPLPMRILSSYDEGMEALGLSIESNRLRAKGALVHPNVPDAYNGHDDGRTTQKPLRVIGATDRQADGSPIGAGWASGERA